LKTQRRCEYQVLLIKRHHIETLSGDNCRNEASRCVCPALKQADLMRVGLAAN
jgi:hypothetical protein